MENPRRQEVRMDAVQAWLAQMPREGIRSEIAKLEEQLRVLRLLDQITPLPQGSPEREAISQAADADARGRNPLRRRAEETGLATPKSRVRVSPERAAIIEAIRQKPEGMTPTAVAQQLGREVNPIQTNMSRMTKHGMLLRVGQGLYKLPTHATAASLLDGDGDGDGDSDEEGDDEP